ncbi:hypothetical protein [Photobacterium sp. TY1-4]|uniref:hypothetical protein n=1 Tax=Photobacterium sp. TY1-4 TaxID=2899122 RepID=UPI0021BEC6AF|nr:hypothetical protein [Photobacterium sp. TY1-4]UXI01031.1 hypothetical protein NH461_14765 [Photobacterium sp. TY1-4]
MFRYAPGLARFYFILYVGLITLIGPISVLHALDADPLHHHVQTCTICHLATDAAGTLSLPLWHATSAPLHGAPLPCLAGHDRPNLPLARAPPIYACN